ncbi:hypothetical protein EGT74_22965 [Chitinophaga lutea]|uniref:Uncharacterized protein n=1 Tax=Chitinophaga lutea TaxID=2488634 RepID=A0A3N4PPY7_9BACT|nr:hypothetical protein EGT74_22965 [Chitinophaga lutea]
MDEIYQYAWFFFMQYGLIPWWMQQETPATLEENIIGAVQRHEALCRHKWAKAWAANRLNIQRWVQQCSSATQQAVLRAVFGDAAGKAAIAAEGGLLQRFSEQAATAQNHLRCIYWDALFGALMAGGGPLRLKDRIREKWRNWMQADITISSSKLLDGISFPEVLQGFPAPVPRKIITPPASSPNLDIDEPLQVKQAGLVLLQHQLPSLFGRLNWLEPAAALQRDFHARALHLLEFMAGGAEQTPEYNMALHKLLCGLPLDAPVEKDVQLTAAEKQCALTSLDEAAALYGMHRDGLRSGWLQREGRLQYSHDAWRLQINRQTAGNPPGSDPVRLPWMRQLLTVQWTP